MGEFNGNQSLSVKEVFQTISKNIWLTESFGWKGLWTALKVSKNFYVRVQCNDSGVIVIINSHNCFVGSVSLRTCDSGFYLAVDDIGFHSFR